MKNADLSGLPVDYFGNCSVYLGTSVTLRMSERISLIATLCLPWLRSRRPCPLCGRNSLGLHPILLWRWELSRYTLLPVNTLLKIGEEAYWSQLLSQAVRCSLHGTLRLVFVPTSGLTSSNGI